MSSRTEPSGTWNGAWKYVIESVCTNEPYVVKWQLSQKKRSITTTATLQSFKWLEPKPLYYICRNVCIVYVIGFGVEQEDGDLVTPIALAHPFHPIKSRSKNKQRNLSVGRCVSSWWPCFWSITQIIIIYISSTIDAFWITEMSSF